ncbi:SAM-dependent methyltransferase [Saccharothrix obliqua]|uniref:SAM-dependent methyltransferase n=1 Tax=Saccharothrix obliqua TaxID=2861747 RepID=UPI001C5E907E|nr:SAM-dependent methyltransferase [Saccharothrix obliqua]MBW4721144.1 SAM-dependent methyltransferase [Saccharothrix obliqua]
MAERLGWAPDSVDVASPSSARIYDYLLGGGHNFAADRAVAEDLARVLPVRQMARLNRSYLRRAVQALVAEGITQFLDLGSGIPTVGNVHEVAQEADPACRVVYVDVEPVAVTHAGLLLAANRGAGAVQADLRDPEAVLDAPETRRLLDLDRPIGLLAVGVLQFVPDEDDPWDVLARYRDALAPGSHLALSHFTPDRMPRAMAAGADIFRGTAEPITPRTREQVLAMMDGFELIPPGLVFTPEWRPESPEDVPSDPGRANLYAAVGRKP